MRTRKLRPPDAHHVKAAQGWLELGNHLEANDELEKVTASLRSHPDVLEVRFQVYAKAEKWEACLEIGTALVKLAPKNPSSYLCHAAALHRLKRTHHAHDQLLHAVRMFPKDWRVRYALARYACRLGKLE
ncbi:MAG TPA: hypothetical protein VFA90_17220 [Terriglobales bacterium]|nr:hypothetical protein [Terriglobales bacterium]